MSHREGDAMGTNATRSHKTVTAGAVALLGAWAGLASAGCGGVSGIPIDETATRIANTVCPKAYMCCTADELAMNSGQAGTDVASCESDTKSNYQNVLSALQSSVDQKRATYQSAQLDACLATIMASDCTTLNRTTHLTGIPGCESFTTPLVAVGGACSQDYECINGWCNVPSTSTNGEGVCAGFVPLGMSCAAAGGPSCGPNFVCDPEGTADASDDLCEPVSPNDGACLDNYQCQSFNCSSSGGSGMTCQPPTTATPMCFYQSSGCSEAGGRPGAGTLLLFAAFAAVAFARAGRARRSR
jgi:hypothetical protein